MLFLTWAQIKAKVEKDLDLEDELFIDTTEMLGYGNEAVDEVERQIHRLNEDYFLTRSTLTLVSGTEEYDLPTDIYAMKIRGVVYRNGTQVWKIERSKDWAKFENYEQEKSLSANVQGNYNYFIVNTTAGSPKVLFTPTPREAGAFIKLWYIRNANRFADDTSILDIPEAANYVIQYVKKRCLEKEQNPLLAQAVADLDQQRQDTWAVLANMVQDNSTELEMDLSSYEEMS